ncbi:hypothetical protein HanRHA438_Chr09g0427091 [Helianthus annuus]|uniref:Uncharacterized protein n=1 Tax=Helianthus annuus TaxID=4232 RepID=A0A9K3IAP3_HELAN|nr:hypothetical protein HanXRQr2_Chr09g0414941 [Helianthus annuus]KAJ0528058.1 hypothetical protein HanHA300_Chr09g0340991 [Helianthus annuus]KAJ0536928.1 hypothetical protein HanIR_Chr09g0447111 [Helianthus annuus]KAJ0544492.1 hypothetical protein HanHA89_Chr09g0362271 [Helianthus annuus]KAJ0709494.1 hypothetical protein HanLR1_Chr09g0341011 [Helianthus annuus]
MLETEISIQVIFDAFTVGKYILKVPELRSNQPVNSPCQRVTPVVVPSPPHRNALLI